MEWIDSPKVSHLRPYLKIMRFDNVTGAFLLLWPCLISIGFASEREVPLLTFLLFSVGAIVMRSAGCIINDIVDSKLDAKVERTKNRPLANGDLKMHEAILLLFLLFTIGGVILFSMSSTAIILGCVIVIPIFIYPLMKRITYWPQLFLACTINWGALMGWAEINNAIPLPAIMIYVACMFWTLGYDTIYAHQDKNDDMLLGIKSTALKFGSSTRKYIYVSYVITTVLFWSVGILMGSGILFHLCLIIGAFQLFWQANSVNFDDAQDCMAKFSSNRYFGFIVFIGVMLGKIVI